MMFSSSFATFLDSCWALKDITRTELDRYPKLKDVRLTGFQGPVPYVQDAQRHIEMFLEYLSSEVQLAEVEDRNLHFDKVLSRAKNNMIAEQFESCDAQQDLPECYKHMNAFQLRKECKERDLPATGNKNDMLDRLTQDDEFFPQNVKQLANALVII